MSCLLLYFLRILSNSLSTVSQLRTMCFCCAFDTIIIIIIIMVSQRPTANRLHNVYLLLTMSFARSFVIGCGMFCTVVPFLPTGCRTHNALRCGVLPSISLFQKDTLSVIFRTTRRAFSKQSILYAYCRILSHSEISFSKFFLMLCSM